jgi:hypothetical protein
MPACENSSLGSTQCQWTRLCVKQIPLSLDDFASELDSDRLKIKVVSLSGPESGRFAQRARRRQCFVRRLGHKQRTRLRAEVSQMQLDANSASATLEGMLFQRDSGINTFADERNVLSATAVLTWRVSPGRN